MTPREAAGPLLAVLPAVAWLPHKLVRKPDGHLDKPPCEGARTNDPSTWFTFDAALALLTGQNDVAGIGFAVTDGVITFDFDHCRDPITGQLADEVQREVERLESYTYTTPSLTGIRVVGTNDPGHPIPGGKSVRWLPDGHRVEIFVGPTSHYNTLTADVLPGYETLRDISEETLDYLSGLDGGRQRAGDAPASNPDPQRSIGAIVAALAAIGNLSRDWDLWSRIGMAAWRASGGRGAGLDAWMTWSARHPCHDPAACEERWQHWFSSPPTRLGFGTLYYEARRFNPLFVAPFDPAEEEQPAGPGRADDGPLPFDPEVSDHFEATPLSAMDLDNIPPRRWVYGHELIQGFVSVLAAIGGAGKTAYTMAVGVSVTLNRPLFHKGVGKPPDHCTTYVSGAGVWFYNLEDPHEELRRRIKATLRHHNVPIESVKDRIFMDSGRDRPLIIAVRAKSGDLIASPLVEPLIAELKRRKITLLVVDPLVQSHNGEENRNDEMNFVMSLWARVASEADCAVWLIHHFRKGGAGGDADSIRGAGAIQGAARAMHTIAVMSEEDAIRVGVQPDERRKHIRHDNVKQNMAPMAATATWFRLASVDLGNGTETYPGGDAVQAVEAWTIPGTWSGVDWDKIEKILARIEKGPEPGEFYTSSRQGSKGRWAGVAIMDICANSYTQATGILKTWIENGVLEEGAYVSPSKRSTIGCVRVNQSKFQEMRRAFQAPEGSESDC